MFTKKVKSLLEIAVPAWHCGLTASQSDKIERVQKTAMRIIFEESLPSAQARNIIDFELLLERRE